LFLFKLFSQLQELERRNRAKDLEIDRLKQKLIHLAEKERDTNQRNRHILAQIKAGDVTFLGDKALLASPPPSPEGTKHTTMAGGGSTGRGSGGGSASTTTGAANASFHSAASKGSVGSARTATTANKSRASAGLHSPGFVTSTTVVSLTAVVDALESQRKELFARNKELELQVRDLLQALQRAENRNPQRDTGGGARSAERRSSSPTGRSSGPSRGGPADASFGSGTGTVGNSTTAQHMLQRIQHQEGQIEALQRQLELNQAVLAEREETIAVMRQR
jgi:regulator of replication initiation timing